MSAHLDDRPRIGAGCCWETFYIFAYCGVVVEIQPLLIFKSLPPSNVNQEKRVAAEMGRSATECLNPPNAVIWARWLAHHLFDFPGKPKRPFAYKKMCFIFPCWF